MKRFLDIETGEVLTLADLEREFNTLKANRETETENFAGYLRNCTDKNGTLVECTTEFIITIPEADQIRLREMVVKTLTALGELTEENLERALDGRVCDVEDLVKGW